MLAGSYTVGLGKKGKLISGKLMSWNMSFLWNIHLAPADCPNTVYHSYHNFNWMPPAHGIKEALNRDKEQGLA